MNGVDPPETAGARRRMVHRLSDKGYVPPGWAEALASVPRHVFAPDVLWLPTPKGYLPWRRADDEPSWLELVHGDDERIVAQVDDGEPGVAGRYPTCTVLSPTEVTWLLSLVTVTPGTRVCVVGAGLGYTTALLAHRLGPEAVCAVEVDAGLAEECRRRLASVSLGAVEVRTADGTAELPGDGAFDVLLSTVTVRQVPPAWLRRVRGTVVTGLGNAYCPDPVVRLTVRDGQATGHVVGDLQCEWARGHRIRPALPVTPEHVTVTFDVERAPESHDARFAIGMRVPDCARIWLADDDHWLTDPATGSHARWHRLPFGRHRVDQHGPRHLWDEVDQAHRWWTAAGRPRAEDWLITATTHGTTTTLPACQR